MKRATFKWHQEMSDRQYTVLTWWNNELYKDFDGIIADGAIRSGKTISMGFSFVVWAMETFDGMDFALCGKTIGSLRRNVTNTLKAQINQRKGWKAEEKRSDNLIIVTHNGRSNNFYMFGGTDERSQDLIQGITLAGIFFDEVALMPESFVNQGTARCSVEGSKYWFNCNPSSPMHWFYVKWIKMCRQRNLLYLHFTMDDNLTLSEKIKARYRAMYTGVFFKRYILGLWVSAEGIVYDMFDRAKHVMKKRPDTAGGYIVSSDYGIQNATVFLLWQRIAGTDKWVCLKEWRYSGREEKMQKTVSALADGFESLLERDEKGRIIKPEKTIIDPSAAALIVEIRKRGYKVIKGKNDVLDGISDVSTMLDHERLFFMEGCKETLKEFSLYSWDMKKADKGKDEPLKTNDHGMDAVRYFVRTMKLVKRHEQMPEDYLEFY